MLSFGAAYYIELQEYGYTLVNQQKVMSTREIQHPVTIEILDKKSQRYGYVKTSQKVDRDIDFFKSTYKDIYSWKTETLYDLVDMETGYVLARTFKNELKEAAKMIADFKHTENGIYISEKFMIMSKRQYKQ